MTSLLSIDNFGTTTYILRFAQSWAARSYIRWQRRQCCSSQQRQEPRCLLDWFLKDPPRRMPSSPIGSHSWVWVCTNACVCTSHQALYPLGNQALHSGQCYPAWHCFLLQLFCILRQTLFQILNRTIKDRPTACTLGAEAHTHTRTHTNTMEARVNNSMMPCSSEWTLSLWKEQNTWHELIWRATFLLCLTKTECVAHRVWTQMQDLGDRSLTQKISFNAEVTPKNTKTRQHWSPKCKNSKTVKRTQHEGGHDKKELRKT